MLGRLKRALELLRGYYLRVRDRQRRQLQEDEFTRWLRYANPGMLEPGNVWSIDHAIRHLPTSAPLVEIGSFAGLSTNVICYLLRKYGCDNSFFTCDNWDVTGRQLRTRIGDSEIDFPEYARFVKSSYMRNINFFSASNRPHTIEAGSREFFARWAAGETVTDVFGRATSLGGPIGFCYVDGLHSYAAVRDEYETIDLYLVPGGFILFDDSSESSPFGLNRLMRQIVASGSYLLVAQNPNYLFRKR